MKEGIAEEPSSPGTEHMWKIDYFFYKKIFLDYLWSAEAGYVFSAIAECDAAFNFTLEQDVSFVSFPFLFDNIWL